MGIRRFIAFRSAANSFPHIRRYVISCVFAFDPSTRVSAYTSIIFHHAAETNMTLLLKRTDVTHTVTSYNVHTNNMLPTPVERRILFRTLLSIRNHSLTDLLIQGNTL